MITTLGPITLDDFLHRNYENERECEYIDGILVERTGGDPLHGLLHVEAGYALMQHRQEWGIEVLMSYSMWVSPTRIRVPDLVVINDSLREKIRHTPPLLCIEILAPEDTLSSLMSRCEDFARMGVTQTWLLDPNDREAFTYTSGDLNRVKAPRLELPGTPIYLDLPELFAKHD